MNTLTPEAIEMLADDYERGMIGPRRLRQYFDYLIQQLAAANAELAAAVKKVEDFDLVVVMNKKICSELDAAKARVTELEQQQFAGQTWVTFNEHMKSLNKIKQMEDAINFDFERFMEFQRRAEQAEHNLVASNLHVKLLTEQAGQAEAQAAGMRSELEQIANFTDYKSSWAGESMRMMAKSILSPAK